MRARLAVSGFLPLMLLAQSSRQQPGDQKELLRQVAFEQRLNAQLPLELPFRDETGRAVKLGDYFTDKPVLLMPVYYECPMLCNLSMGEVVKTLRTLTLAPGKDFRVVMFSFDPTEKSELAADKKKAYLKRYGRPETADGWTFLTGEQADIKALTDSIGYRTAYDASIRQYAHAAGFVIATAQGKVSRYLYGLEYSARDVRLGVVESSQGKIGNPVDQLLLMCFHYDPKSGLYTMSILTVMRVAGVFTIACIGGFLIVNFRRERRQKA